MQDNMRPERKVMVLGIQTRCKVQNTKLISKDHKDLIGGKHASTIHLKLGRVLKMGSMIFFAKGKDCIAFGANLIPNSSGTINTAEAIRCHCNY